MKLAVDKAAVDAVHAIRPDLPAGWTLVGSPFKAAPGGEERAAAAREEICDRFYRASAGDDFVGIQTYSRSWYARMARLTHLPALSSPSAVRNSTPRPSRRACELLGISRVYPCSSPKRHSFRGRRAEESASSIVLSPVWDVASATVSRSWDTPAGPRLTISSGFSVWPEVRDHLRRSRDATPYREADNYALQASRAATAPASRSVMPDEVPADNGRLPWRSGASTTASSTRFAADSSDRLGS